MPNSSSYLFESHHEYPIDLLTVGSFKCATSDINNQIIIWSLNTSLTAQNESCQNLSFNLNSLNDRDTSIWSICISPDDQYLFVGQSDGRLRAFSIHDDVVRGENEVKEYSSGQTYCDKSEFSAANNGITHLINLNKFNRFIIQEFALTLS